MSLLVDCNYLQPSRRQNVCLRLNRIEGQVRGVRKMIDRSKTCVEILNQIASIEKALVGVKKVILRNYLETCFTKAIKFSPSKGMYDELMEVIYKYS